VLTVPLSSPIPAMDGGARHSVTFTRGPGLGELVGFLDESSPESLARSLDTIAFRPEWVIHVLSRCAGVPKSDASLIAACDLLALGSALRPFVLGGGASRGPSSALSPPDSDGDLEQSPN